MWGITKFLGILIGVLLSITLFFTGSISSADSFFDADTSLSFELLNRQDGLTNLSVSSIIQDKNGFVWFGTQSGLNKYDGREIQTIRNDPFDDFGLVHNLIQTMYYDESSHQLLIGTYQGISQYDIDLETFTNYTVEENDLSHPIVIAIEKDFEGNIWAGTMAGLNKINPKTKKIESYEVSGNVIRDLMWDSNGNLLIGTYKGLKRFDFEENKIVDMPYELESDYVMVIREFEPGILTLGLWDGGVAEINTATGAVTSYMFADNRVYDLVKTSDGTLWIGTWGGGLFAKTSSGRVHHYPGYLEHNDIAHPIVYSFMVDESGILWVGTNGGGVCKVNPRKHSFLKWSYEPDNKYSLPKGKINRIYYDKQGDLWISIYNAGLARLGESDRFDKFKYVAGDQNTLPSDQVSDILDVEGVGMLVGTNDGIAVFNSENQQFIRYGDLPKGIMIYALEKGRGSTLWVGTYLNGVYKYDMDANTYEHFGVEETGAHKLSDNLIYDLELDKSGKLWIATNHGLNRYDPELNSMKSYARESGNREKLSKNTIRTLFEDSRGRLWIGLIGGGLASYDESSDSFKTYTEKDGLSDNVVMGILEDDDGRIWVSTHSGLSIINLSTETITVLSPSDGIGGWEFNAGHAKGPSGQLLFGGIHGITVIPETYMDQSSSVPPLYIMDFQVNQQKYEISNNFYNDLELELEQDERFVSFRVAALDYDAPDKVHYQYRLIGLEDEWIDNGMRDFFSFSNLSYGTYELQVKAITSKNVVTAPVSMKFTIATPITRTPVAYVIYTLFIIGLIYAAVKVREAVILGERNSELSELNEKLETANIQLETIATMDSLTGVYNRRYFDTKLDELMKMAIRSQIDISLIMLDVDNFKRLNDTHGHAFGDVVLKTLATCVNDNLPRETDFIARFGGDEFGLIFFDTDVVGAQKVARIVQENINMLDIDNMQITVSMGGVSIIPTSGMTLDDLVQAADERLYKVKSEGRNSFLVERLDYF